MPDGDARQRGAPRRECLETALVPALTATQAEAPGQQALAPFSPVTGYELAKPLRRSPLFARTLLVGVSGYADEELMRENRTRVDEGCGTAGIDPAASSVPSSS